MKRALPLLLALSACASQPRYIQIACLSPAQFEELKSQLPPKIHDRLTGKADEDVRVIAGSNLRLRAYGESLLEVLRGCTTQAR